MKWKLQWEVSIFLQAPFVTFGLIISKNYFTWLSPEFLMFAPIKVDQRMIIIHIIVCKNVSPEQDIPNPQLMLDYKCPKISCRYSWSPANKALRLWDLWPLLQRHNQDKCLAVGKSSIRFSLLHSLAHKRPQRMTKKTLLILIPQSVFTYSSQPPFMILVCSEVFARRDQLVIHTGHVAADPGHLSGDVDWTLLSLRLQLYCLIEKQTNKHKETGWI